MVPSRKKLSRPEGRGWDLWARPPLRVEKELLREKLWRRRVEGLRGLFLKAEAELQHKGIDEDGGAAAARLHRVALIGKGLGRRQKS